jgi:hypothetical protein
VQDLQLILKGRGVVKKGSDENITLACYHADCSRLRFVHFFSPTVAYYIGDTIITPTSENEGITRKAIELVAKEYFYTHYTYASAKQVDRGMARNGAMILGGITVIALASKSNPLLGMGIGVPSTVAAMVVFTSPKAIEATSTGTGGIASFSDSKGWNWSTHPKEVNTETFASIFERINSGVRLESFESQIPGSTDRDRKLEGKIGRAYNRLLEQGVEFHDQSWDY